jgi:exodeoxyribonuclease VII small subunit
MAEKTFEQSLARLEEIVKLLEKGDAPLAESLGLFEEGAGLIRTCGAMLDTAEQKVVQLRKSADGTPEELPFE